ncbi:MAG: cytochrome-c peroxidase [Thiohalomonadales bacterium]
MSTLSRIVVFFLISVFTVTFSHAFEYLQPLPNKPLVPKDNPLSQAKILLGKWLFYQTGLSKNKKLSCNHCHNLLAAGSDGLPFSRGHDGKLTKRSTPALWNIGLQTVLNWDGRYKTLEEQAEAHIKDPDIMAMSDDIVMSRFANNKEFVTLFKSASPNVNVNIKSLALALASFQRSLLAPNSPFDLYIQGDKTALSDLAIRGMKTFNQAGCLACHFGVNFAGPAPGPAMDIGDGFYELFPTARGSSYEKQYKLLDDKGRYEFSKDLGEIYMWRVPSLRNIALSPPYFHNGSAKTLREAIMVMAKVQFKIDLSETQIDELSAFLRSLTGQRPRILNVK